MRSTFAPRALALASAIAVFMPQSAYATCAACDEYKRLSYAGQGSTDHAGNALSRNAIIEKCGDYKHQIAKAPDGSTLPTSGTGVTTIDQGMDPNFISGDQAWDDCYGKWQAQWALLGQYCEPLS